MTAGGLAILPEPTAPSNFKDPIKIAANIAGQKEVLAAQANNYPVVGTVVEAVLLNQHGENVFSVVASIDGSDVGRVSYDTLTFLSQWLRGGASTMALGEEFLVYGFNIHDTLRMMAVDAASFAVAAADDLPPPPMDAWYSRLFQPTFMCDPYTTLIDAGYRKVVSLEVLLGSLMIPFVDVSPGAKIHAAQVQQLVIKSGL